jgi:hypothetical protein
MGLCTVRYTIILLIVAVLGVSGVASARLMEVATGGGLVYYDGDKGSSFVGDQGMLVNFTTVPKTKSWFKFLASFAVGSSSGTIRLSGADTNYSFLNGEFMAGFKIVPMPSSTMMPYFGASGSVIGGKVTINAPEGSTIPETDHGRFYGYNISTGVDLMLGKEWGVRLEVQNSTISGQFTSLGSWSLSGLRGFVSLFFQ